jgi:hypothetical protein
MLLPISAPVISTYCVEVSGWDNSKSFFTEKSELEWSEEAGKRIKLSRALPKGTMIFVRLLQPTVSDSPSTVAYWAEFMATTPEGFHQFHLKQVQPRT